MLTTHGNQSNLMPPTATHFDYAIDLLTRVRDTANGLSYSLYSDIQDFIQCFPLTPPSPQVPLPSLTDSSNTSPQSHFSFMNSQESPITTTPQPSDDSSQNSMPPYLPTLPSVFKHFPTIRPVDSLSSTNSKPN